MRKLRGAVASLVFLLTTLVLGAQGAMASNLIYGPYAGMAAVGAPGTAPPDSCAVAPSPTTSNWALETYNVAFTVKSPPPPSGTYTVTPRYSKGHFTTLGGDSPGKCDSSTTHGSTVPEAVTGAFGGNQHLMVTPGASGFNPSGACIRDSSGMCTVGGFVHGFFGSDATYTLQYYRFTYTASDTAGLIATQWITQINTALDTGDVASA